jgi:tRNA threonylcarbamoyladenosine biosynthesis protein TsaB
VKRLVIDTATSACSVALFDGHTLVAGEHVVIGRGHAERLLPMIANLPERGRADAIHVNIGPGSFTGIRVGVSAARALGMAWKAECHGFGCLEFLAAMTRLERGTGKAIDVAITGGHGEYYFQSFDPMGRAIDGPLSVTPTQAASLSLASVVVGDVAAKLCEIRGSGEPLTLAPDARAFMALSGTPPMPPSPAYVRAPDAKPQQVRVP